jgi:hypothetical protein
MSRRQAPRCFAGLLAACLSVAACSSKGPRAVTPPAGDDAAGDEPDSGAAPVDAAGARPDADSPDAGGQADTAVVDLAAPPAADAAADALPPAGDAPKGARHAALIWGYGEERPTPRPTDPLMPLDLTMKSRLEAKGLIVDPLEDAVSSAAAVMDKVLIVISNSVDRRNLFDAAKKPKFRDVRVPAIVMKDGVIEVMGMGTGSNGGFSTPVGQTQIAIVAPGDPLAAGLMGNVTVYTKMGGAACPPCYLKVLQTSDRLIYAFPSAQAKTIATIVGNPKESAIFAYPAGAMMVGLTAPAKRMGFFIHRDTDYSPDGVKLFDAAIDYLLAP